MELHKNKYSTQRAPLQVTYRPAVFAVLTAVHELATRPRARPTPRVPARADAEVVAIDCSAEPALTNPEVAPAAKACKTCGVEKPLTDFIRKPTAKDGRSHTCRTCYREVQSGLRPSIKAQARIRREQAVFDKAREELQRQNAMSSPVPYVAAAKTAVKTIADLVTFDSLRDTARRLKGKPAVYDHGRTRIAASYDRKCDVFDFTIGGWPVSGEDMARVFAQIESGQGLRGMF